MSGFIRMISCSSEKIEWKIREIEGGKRNDGMRKIRKIYEKSILLILFYCVTKKMSGKKSQCVSEANLKRRREKKTDGDCNDSWAFSKRAKSTWFIDELLKIIYLYTVFVRRSARALNVGRWMQSNIYSNHIRAWLYIFVSVWCESIAFARD